MNTALAKIHFPSDEDPEEQYAEKLFRLKQFFFRHNPVPKVLDSKIRELETIHAAFKTRFPNVELDFQNEESVTPFFTGNLLEDVKTLQNSRTVYRNKIARAHHAFQMIELLKLWYSAELLFALNYSSYFLESDLTDVNLTVNVDPMNILDDILSLDKQRYKSNDQLLSISHLPETLKRELKRCAKFVLVHSEII
jgi:hypothetical protein